VTSTVERMEASAALPTWLIGLSGMRRGEATNERSGGPEGSHLRAPADPGVT
jgi:hypothetical protein